MKKMVLVLAAFLSVTVMMAQDNEKCECKSQKHECKSQKQMTPECMTEKMAKDLSLTEEQKTKVLALNNEYKDVIGKGPRMGGQRPPKAPADGETGASEQKQRPERPQLTDAQKKEMKAAKAKREEYQGKLKKILTDEQYKKYEKAQKRGHHGGHHGGPKGPRPSDASED